MNTPHTTQDMTDWQARIKDSCAERFRLFQEKEAAKKSEGGFIYRLEKEGVVLCGCEQAFSGELLIPEIIGGHKVYKIEHAFKDCEDLQRLIIPDSVSEVVSDIFGFCISLEAFEVSSSNPHLCSQDGVLFSKDMKQLMQYPQARRGSYTVPNGVTTIRMLAFECCHGLTALTIPDDVTTIGFSAFAYCVNLEQVTLSSRLQEIDYTLFTHCVSLDAIRIPHSVTAIKNGAFDSCKSLKSVVLPPNLGIIGLNAFMGCASLEEISIPAQTVDIDAGAFSNCESLNAIHVDAGNAVYYSRQGVLFDRMKAELIQYPAGRSGSYAVQMGTLSISKAAFCGCTRLTEIILPDTVTRIGRQAFLDCISLKKISLPGSLQTIPDEAFIGCINLREVIVPASVTTVCHLAFAGCSLLERLIFEGSAPYVTHEAFACIEHAAIYYQEGMDGWVEWVEEFKDVAGFPKIKSTPCTSI